MNFDYSSSDGDLGSAFDTLENINLTKLIVSSYFLHQHAACQATIVTHEVIFQSGWESTRFYSKPI
jgi:hypothetical protein